MNATDVARKARDIAHRGLELDEMCMAFDALMRSAVPYAVAAWSSHDPATGLFTSCTLSGLPVDHAREAQMFRYEFREDEPASFASLIRDGETIAILSEVTGGDLTLAGRYKNLLVNFGVTDELRAVLRADDRPWGSASLFKMEGRFTADEAAVAEALAPHAAEGIRLVLLRSAAVRPEAVDEPPGIVEVSAGGEIIATTGPAQRWLRAGGARLQTALNVTAAAVRERSDWEGAASRLTLDDGRMLSLHAASKTSEDGGVAVIIGLARPAEVSSMLVDAYGFTPRQREVLGLILLGLSMTQIASRLGISEHTAHDHRKAIYRRLEVSSRAELAGRLQAEQYDPCVHGNVPPSPYGGFLRA